MNGHINIRLARLTLQSLAKKASGRLDKARLDIQAGATDLQDELDYWQGNLDALKEADILLGTDAFNVETD